MVKRKFGDGGDVEDTGVREGPNSNIGDDTRSRAMAWVKKMQEGSSSEETPAKKVVNKTKTKVAVKKPIQEDTPTIRPGQSRQDTFKAAQRQLDPNTLLPISPMKCGGKVKKMAKGGGIELRGKTRGKVC